jgi:hypothetical protein
VVILVLTASAEALALVLRLSAKNVYAVWVLAVSTLPALSQVANDFLKDLPRSRGLTDSDMGLLGLELAIVALALLSQWRLSRLLFWTGWALNVTLTAVLAYVIVEWRPFA